ncbi:MAG: hypothetical protein QG650_916 [Patescibacteria group bacterium]|nr:hypothetical protein [Patescibacteria group bacterium]
MNKPIAGRTPRNPYVADSSLPVSGTPDIGEIRDYILEFRRAAIEIRNLVGPRCEDILSNEEIPEKGSGAWEVISEIRQLLPSLIENVSVLEKLVDVPENFASVLEHMGRTVSTSMAGSAPEIRRFRMISESLELLREFLDMDYAGIWLLRRTGDVAIHESGILHESADMAVIHEQVQSAIEGTKDGKFAYLDPSDSEDGGVDAVFVFRHLDGEPIGYLLLDDYTTAHDIDINAISEVAKTFYIQLRAIIHEEETFLARKETLELRKEMERMQEELRKEMGRMQEELHGSQHDKLTGLVLRGTSEPIIENSIARLRRSDEGRSVALCMLDIDFFKKVNDTYGHAMGDKVLAAVGGVLSGKSTGEIHRQSDVVSRWGGEEFVLFLDDTDEYGAKSVLKRIVASIKELVFTDPNTGDPFRISVTVGIKGIHTADLSRIDRNESLVGHFLKLADESLYHGKESGRDIIVVHEEGAGLPPKPTEKALKRPPTEKELDEYASLLPIFRERTLLAFEKKRGE